MERTEIIRATCKVIDNRDLKNGLKDSSICLDFKKLSRTEIDFLINLSPKKRKNIPSNILGEYSTIELNKKL
jgi:hypothetical protein|tara:strand:+ start:1934 stop:2149 length:216 start_codon:yes stop_codon:yes gene_type:complete